MKLKKLITYVINESRNLKNAQILTNILDKILHFLSHLSDPLTFNKSLHNVITYNNSKVAVNLNCVSGINRGVIISNNDIYIIGV